MNRLFKNSSVRFVVFITLVILYAVITGTSVTNLFEEYLTQEQTQEFSQPTPTQSPEVYGVSIASDSAVVSEVIDGDTIRLSSGEKVRYIGVDTPETKDPRVGKECFGEEAALFNELLVLGKTVRLEKDVNETDRYGRLLRYVWLDEKMVNQTLVEEGYAQATPYPPDVKYQDLFEQLERGAREKGVGLWSSCPVN